MIWPGWSAVNIHVDWSLLLSLVSILVTVLVAVYSHRKVQTAREAARVARQKLFNQRAAEDFDEMARGAANLSMVVRNQDWRHGAELATALRTSLARANGSWPGLLKGFEKDKLEVAANEIKSLIGMIPVDERAIDAEVIRQMMEQCNFAIDVVAEIAGRLKYLEED